MEGFTPSIKYYVGFTLFISISIILFSQTHNCWLFITNIVVAMHFVEVSWLTNVQPVLLWDLLLENERAPGLSNVIKLFTLTVGFQQCNFSEIPGTN